MTKSLARSIVHSIGVVAALRRFRRAGVRILMYHRFHAQRSVLAEQCAHLARHYQPVSLADVAECYDAGRPLPPNAVAVTVDDGYLDFLTLAHPVFRRYGIRPTVFLVTDFIDGRRWLWWDAVAYVLDRTTHDPVRVSMPDGSTLEFGMTWLWERRAAHAEICRILTDWSTEDRARTIEQLSADLEVDLPSTPPPSCAPLAWDEIRRLAAEGVEFGAHTRTHANLARLGDEQRLRDEIVASKLRIESELQRPVVHFCYPNGRRQDFSADAVDLVARSGFRTAVTTERGINAATTPRFLLRRLGAEPALSVSYLDELLVGLRIA